MLDVQKHHSVFLLLTRDSKKGQTNTGDKRGILLGG